MNYIMGVRKNYRMINPKYLLLFMLLTGSDSIAETHIEENEAQIQIEENTSLANTKNDLIQENFISTEEESAAETSRRLDEYAQKIQELKSQIETLEKPDRFDLSAILLTAVAVIVTVLGVILAIISFYGYRNIKKIAEKVARKAAQKTVRALLEETTVETIGKLLDEGKFDKLIAMTVETVAYRGVGDNDLFDNELRD